MRVRNRKGATELLEANPQYVVLNPLEAKGKWRDLFGNDNPIHVEVGSGRVPLFQVWLSKTLTSTISGLIFKSLF